MSEVCRITVPWDVGLTRPNVLARSSWRTHARTKKKARETAHLAWIAAGRPSVDEPVVVQIVIRRGRVLDSDGALAACKALIDGLFVKAITPHDGCVTWLPVKQETGRGRPVEVEFIVRTAGDRI